MASLIRVLMGYKLRVLSMYYGWRVRRVALGCGEELRVNGKSSVSRNTLLGRNVNFNGMTISGGGRVVVGDNFHSGPDCLMVSQNHNFDEGASVPYDRTYVCKDITIEDQVWLASRVIVLGGVTIGEGAIIQAGSVVVSDIPKYAIAGGHPCKVFSSRDVDHYERLKRESQFF